MTPPLKMHRCLKVPEILALILDNFIEPKFDSPSVRRPWPFEGSKTLVNVATSCKAFMEPALDRLWFFIPELDYLVACLPEDAWIDDSPGWPHVESTVRLARPLLPEDFVRFDYYAAKIRILGEFSPEQYSLDGPPMDHLVLPYLISQNSSKMSLLPRLEYYNAPTKHFEGHAWPARAAVSLGLHFLHIRLEDGRNSVKNLSVISHAAITVDKIAGTLKGFNVVLEEDQALGSELEPPQTLRDLIPRFRCIQRLNILNYEVDSKALHHLVGLSTLRTLAITLKPEDMKTFLDGKSTVLCQLHDISLRTDSLMQCAQLLPQLQPPSLDSLKLVRRRASTEKWDLEAFFEVMSKWRFMTGVSSIQVQAPIYSAEPENAATNITGNVIRLLLPFKNLRILRLSMNSHVLIGPDMLHKMGQAWPALEILNLRERTLGTTPEITFCDVTKFIAACPELKTLSLRMDASNPDFNFTDVHNIPQSHCLTLLNVCTSPIRRGFGHTGASPVSEYVAFAYPNLEELRLGWEYRTEEGVILPSTHLPGEVNHYTEWKNVRGELEDLMLLRR